MQMKQGQEASGLKHVTTFVFCPTKEMPFWKLCTIGASDYMMPKRNIGCGRLANRRNEYMMFIPLTNMFLPVLGVVFHPSFLLLRA